MPQKDFYYASDHFRKQLGPNCGTISSPFGARESVARLGPFDERI
jgi:hypothetical protein